MIFQNNYKLEKIYTGFIHKSQLYSSTNMHPKVQAHNINYPHSLIHLIQGNLFHGLPNEDPYAHLATYIEICNTVKIARVPDDAMRLILFSFSLAKRTHEWESFVTNHEISPMLHSGIHPGIGGMMRQQPSLLQSLTRGSISSEIS